MLVDGHRGNQVGLTEPDRDVLDKLDTILAWNRKLMAQKCDGSQQRKAPQLPRIDEELDTMVIRLAQENRTWGYDQVAGTRHCLYCGHFLGDYLTQGL
jgi:putative transposase